VQWKFGNDFVIRVELEVMTDPATGLTIRKFTWNEGQCIQFRWRIANRAEPMITGAGPLFAVRAYNPDIDGPIGEHERTILEWQLNNPEGSCS
jgi:hypothetical protein